MAVFDLFSRRLYLRLWLAVVGGVAVLTLAVGWAWRIAAEQNAQPMAPPAREVVLRDSNGNTLIAGLATRVPGPPGEGLELAIDSADGATYSLQLAPRADRGNHTGPNRRPEAAFWTRPPFGFLWMLGLVGLGGAVGV